MQSQIETKISSKRKLPFGRCKEIEKIGLDIASISELSPGITDLEVLALAVQEQRIIITFDGDYGELLFLKCEKAPPGVIYLRVIPKTADKIAEQVYHFLTTTDVQVTGHFIVLGEMSVRTRPLD